MTGRAFLLILFHFSAISTTATAAPGQFLSADDLATACRSDKPKDQALCDGVARGVGTGLWYGRFVYGGDRLLCRPFEAREEDAVVIRQAFLDHLAANPGAGGEHGPKVMIEGAFAVMSCS